jgi:hypothetical protein
MEQNLGVNEICYFEGFEIIEAVIIKNAVT